MDLDAVCTGIAAAVKAAELNVAGTNVTATPFQPDSLTPPHFYTAEFTETYDKTHGGLTLIILTSRLMVTRGVDKSSQRALQILASSGATGNIRAALNAARGAPGQKALDGAADDLQLQRAQGPRLYEVGGDQFYGLEFTIQVWG